MQEVLSCDCAGLKDSTDPVSLLQLHATADGAAPSQEKKKYICQHCLLSPLLVATITEYYSKSIDIKLTSANGKMGTAKLNFDCSRILRKNCASHKYHIYLEAILWH